MNSSKRSDFAKIHAAEPLNPCVLLRSFLAIRVREIPLGQL